ncbi:MAG: cytochrome c biogenesis protein ResB, partial [Prochlorococcus sp.]
VQVHDANGDLLANLRPGGTAVAVQGLQLSVINVLPASGLLLKRDPGIPLVYAAFALTLLGGGLSVISTRLLWAVKDPRENTLHVGGLCNRNMSGLAHELPELLAVLQRPTLSRADGCHD